MQNRMHQQKTNQQVLREIMSFSRFGALAEVFVMNAVMEQAARVSKMDPDSVAKTAMVNPRAWIGVAEEINRRLDRHYGHEEPQRAAA